MILFFLFSSDDIELGNVDTHKNYKQMDDSKQKKTSIEEILKKPINKDDFFDFLKENYSHKKICFLCCCKKEIKDMSKIFEGLKGDLTNNTGNTIKNSINDKLIKLEIDTDIYKQLEYIYHNLHVIIERFDKKAQT